MEERLKKVRQALEENGFSYHYSIEDGCGSIDFEHRGLTYHIWEFADGDKPCGVETNLFHAGKSQDIEGNYEDILAEEIKASFR